MDPADLPRSPPARDDKFSAAMVGGFAEKHLFPFRPEFPEHHFPRKQADQTELSGIGTSTKLPGVNAASPISSPIRSAHNPSSLSGTHRNSSEWRAR